MKIAPQSIADLRVSAHRRLPRFVWDYLDSATGSEATPKRNRAALDRLIFDPSVLHGEITPDLTTTLLGQTHPLPFGIAPVGMSGLIWPDAEPALARHGAQSEVPYTLSTVATRSPEDLAPHIGRNAWFQLYPPRDPAILDDMLTRIRDAGFTTLVLTLDVPAPSRRERQIRGGLTNPPRVSPRLLAQMALRPAWSLATARSGMPRMRFLDAYSSDRMALPSNAHIGYLLRTSPDRDYLDRLRAAWDGPLIAKGVLRPQDAEQLQSQGVDALWVSNHAGRQFDAAPATIEVLPDIRAATDLPIIFDSGIESGLDILRALSLGADFTMLGRAWHYALAAMGRDGPACLSEMLRLDLIANMHQLGVASLTDLPRPRGHG